MRANMEWLSDWVTIDLSPDALADELTMAGLEVDAVEPVGAGIDGVVVAEIRQKRAHPNADKLSICVVDDGRQRREIVCGAPNAAEGLKVPFAPTGTALPGGLKIEAAKIRGVTSEGILCSARELALADDASGLMVLDADATPGESLTRHLKLDDHVIDIDLTPNRGDCFSVLGIAREIAARHGSGPLDEALDCVEPTADALHDVELIDTAACPRFAGRVVAGLSADARTPDWMRERLRRAGLRPLHPIVDVTNYVMLELGQPLHAYRLDKLDGPIQVRYAQPKEALTLLDGTALTLADDVLVIADRSGAIGLAGIMGGQSTAVDSETVSIFLESAYFAQHAIQGRARRFGLHTDASVRFERGVDPTGQERAIERATALLIQIAGGAAGPLVVAEDETALPMRAAVSTTTEKINGVLGIEIADETIADVLRRLGMEVERDGSGWRVTPPSYRFDIAIEEDLIEEIGRMIGYDEIPVEPASATMHVGTAPESEISEERVAMLMAARGFNEVVSYSFVDRDAQAAITGSADAAGLANPLSQELSVLRSSLWPGLIRVARLNESHQQPRARYFELGTVFEPAGTAVRESTRVAGLSSGSRRPVHWDESADTADIFDLKGDVEALLAVWRRPRDVRFVNETHAALNPVKSSAVYFADERIGWLGELHPKLQREYEFRNAVVLFELDVSMMNPADVPRFSEFSRFPIVRRDLAVVVDDQVAVGELTKLVSETLGGSLGRCEVFDQYRGKGVPAGRKSIGIGLILQDASRTLTDDEADRMIDKVVRRLEHELGATIRN